MYKDTAMHQGEAGHLATYANHVIKNDERPSVRGLQQHIIDKHEKELGKLKSEAGRNKKKAEAIEHINHIKRNSASYEAAIKLHQHIQAAKNELVNTLNQDHGTLTHDIEGQATTPEGHVVLHKGRHVKLVNRAEFSKKNLLKVRK